MISEITHIRRGKRMQDSTVTPTQEPGVTKRRKTVLREIREQLGPNEPPTLRLIDSLMATWDTIDLLMEVFSTEVVQAYVQAGFEAIEVTDDE
jgi:hypothetical protein